MRAQKTVRRAYPCPCGDQHPVSSGVRRAIERHGETQRVLTPAGGWLVPRVYAAVHDIKGPALRAAAARYGFAPAEPTA